MEFKTNTYVKNSKKFGKRKVDRTYVFNGQRFTKGVKLMRYILGKLCPILRWDQLEIIFNSTPIPRVNSSVKTIVPLKNSYDYTKNQSYNYEGTIFMSKDGIEFLSWNNFEWGEQFPGAMNRLLDRLRYFGFEIEVIETEHQE